LILGALCVSEQQAVVALEKTSWEVVRSQDGDFAFSMPAGPAKQARNVPETGGNTELVTYSCSFNGFDYQVQRTRLPRSVAPGEVIAQLALLRKRYAPENARIVSESKIVVDGVIGDDFTIRLSSSGHDADTIRRIRHFLTGRYYYAMTVNTPPGKGLPGDSGRFLSSLTFEALVRAFRAQSTVQSGLVAKARQREEPRIARQTTVRAPTTTVGREGNGSEPRAKVELADSTPELALKTFLLAQAAQDEQTLRAVALPDKEINWLLKSPPATPERLARMKAWLEERPIPRLKAGDPVQMPDGRSRVIKPDDVRQGRVVLWPDGAPLPSRIENVGGHWKVFAPPFIAARKSAEARSKP
jgi:hypothetical protein